MSAVLFGVEVVLVVLGSFRDWLGRTAVRAVDWVGMQRNFDNVLITSAVILLVVGFMYVGLVDGV